VGDFQFECETEGTCIAFETFTDRARWVVIALPQVNASRAAQMARHRHQIARKNPHIMVIKATVIDQFEHVDNFTRRT